MGKRNKQNSKFNLAKAAQSLVKHPYFILIATMLTFLAGAYKCGSYNMSAQKDREISVIEREYGERLIEYDRQYREELINKDRIISDQQREIYELREKCFRLKDRPALPSINSP